MTRLPVPFPRRAALSAEEHRVAVSEVRRRLELLGFEWGGEVLKLNANRGRAVVRCGSSDEYVAKVILQEMYAPLRHTNRAEAERFAHMDMAGVAASRIIPQGIAYDCSGVVMERIGGVSLTEFVIQNKSSAINMCTKVIAGFIEISQELAPAPNTVDARSLVSAEVGELWRVAFQTEARMSRLVGHKLAAPRHIEMDCLKAIERLSVSAHLKASSLCLVFATRDLFVQNIMVAAKNPVVIDWDNAGATFLEFEIATYVASVIALFLQVELTDEAVRFIHLARTTMMQAKGIDDEVFVQALSVHLAAMQINPTFWDNGVGDSLISSYAQRFRIVRRLRRICKAAGL